ncbi:MAG: tetratricopeptide repeat protein [Solirubrobacterales bacterium]|nr:tetratricopeptide repeat protein [Solirubrobacterales bacterium]
MEEPGHRHDSEESSYELYTRGIELLDSGDFAAAAVPLAKLAAREPEKSSVREALGRALFRSRRFGEAAAEFEAVVERYPTNDFAQFCLGRALDLSGHSDRARRHLAIAANLRPDRRDYRTYRQRSGLQASKGTC